jgi:Cu/Ag efflux pump CusA
VYATVIIVLVFVPLFVLPGIEGRLFTPLGVAYIVSILVSMIVSVTVTPVLCYYLLPRMQSLHGDSPLVVWLKVHWDAKLLHGRLPRPHPAGWWPCWWPWRWRAFRSFRARFCPRLTKARSRSMCC